MCARRYAASLGVLVACGCASGPSSPQGWLPGPERTQADAYGGWIEVESRDTVVGELIAAGADTVFVLGAHGLTARAVSDVRRASLWAYDPETGGPAVWMFLGLLSTGSHGAYLVLTAPMWLIGGGVALSGRSVEPRLMVPDRPWADLRAYARFPQGLPSGLDRAQVRPRGADYVSGRP